jgi:hypothetical protein
LARLPDVIEEDEPEEVVVLLAPTVPSASSRLTMADLDGLDHERRGLVSIVVPNVHPRGGFFPRVGSCRQPAS